jgi:hypothetical protein
MQEAIFTVLMITGATATVFALAALVADYFFPERPRPVRIRQRSQATYKKVPK